jgi:GT2 family glycosyltransferase
MNAPKLTVSIVTFRTPLDMLAKLIDSLALSTIPTEIWLIDNTPELEYFQSLARFSNVRRVKSPINGGYGHGHNQAIKASAQASYHLIVNPDVIIHPGCLKTLIDLMEREQNIGLCVPKILFPAGELQPLNKRDPNVLDLVLRRFASAWIQDFPPIKRRMQRYIMMDYGYETSYDVPFASGCFMLFRKSLLRALGGFDERFFMYFEDADLSRRARAKSRVVYVPHATITHAWARGSHSNFRLMLTTFRSAAQYFSKWGVAWF